MRSKSIVAVLVFCCLLYLGFAFYYLNMQPILARQSLPTTARLYPHETAREMVDRLALQHPVRFQTVLRLYFRLTGDGDKLQVGEYSINHDTTVFSLLRKMLSGEVVVYTVTFIEGQRFADMIAILHKNKHIVHDYVGPKKLMHFLRAKHGNPEGLFFPATYQFHWPQGEVNVLQRSYLKMQQVLANAWSSGDVVLPYKNAYQALIMASIIEKETAKDDERARIAGVLVLRLRQGMRLQVDPTVIYGLGRPADYVLRRADLRAAGDYNTYRIKGLPPTPISMPGRAAIGAAMHPEVGGALYYVSKGDGSHYFSKTYAEHKLAIKRYLR